MSKENENNIKNSSFKINNNRYRDFVSGLVAGFISVTVCNPLDITRTRLNLMVISFLFRVLQIILPSVI